MLRPTFCVAVFFFAVSSAAPEPGKKGSLDEANTAATRGQFSHQVSIGITFKTSAGLKTIDHVCSGSILSQEWVLTAAHCFSFPYNEENLGDGTSLNPQDVTHLHLTVGTENLAELEASSSKVDVSVTPPSLVIHEKFGDDNEVKRAYDFALIHVSSGISFFDGFVGPIELVKQGEDPKAGDSAIIAGWGFTSNYSERASAQLLFVKVPIKSDDTCFETYGGPQGDRYWDPKLKICAGGVDWDPSVSVCQSDSGSALEVLVGGKRKLAGVVSTGGRCYSINPVMVARVSTVFDWITEKTGIQTA